MDWIKVSINEVLLSSRKDWETMAIIKYQALYAQLETAPNETQMKRFLNKKEMQFISKLFANDIEVISKLDASDIEMITKSTQNEIQNAQQKRMREKIKYQKKTRV